MSGSGTILEAMLDAGVPVALVVADRPCRGITVAADAGLPAVVVDRAQFGGFTAAFDRDDYSIALAQELGDHHVDLIAMAGFGTVVTAALHNAFPGRVLNTHPSLLPAFKGWHAVEDALASGATETGCTVHVATAALDEGPILAQRRVPILPNDDIATLHERIKQVERVVYPTVVTTVLQALACGDEPATIRVP